MVVFTRNSWWLLGALALFFIIQKPETQKVDFLRKKYMSKFGCLCGKGFDTIKGRKIHMTKLNCNGQSRTPTRTARAPPTAAHREDARPLRLMLQDGSDGGAPAAGGQGDCEPPDAAGYETEESEKPGEFLLGFTDIS